MNLPDRFSDLSPDERLRVLKAGHAMTRFVFARAAAVLIAPHIGRAGRIANGSAFVVRMQSGQYVGTAWHVVRAGSMHGWNIQSC